MTFIIQFFGLILNLYLVFLFTSRVASGSQKGAERNSSKSKALNEQTMGPTVGTELKESGGE
jgi:hypothetical protein